MPFNKQMKLEIFVGDARIPEYKRDGLVYVESNLFCPGVSYTQNVAELVNGEMEMQTVPVTPYAIKVTGKKCNFGKYHPYYRISVDGVKVKGLSLNWAQSKIIKGFRDGISVRELLFSLPRNCKTKDEKMDTNRVTRVGQIEIECWKAERLDKSWELRQTPINFQQASKSDSFIVTQGEYTMATSKVGKVLSKRRIFRSVDRWKRKALVSKLCVRYHMGHTLQSMGFTLKPYPNMLANSGVKSKSERGERINIGSKKKRFFRRLSESAGGKDNVIKAENTTQATSSGIRIKSSDDDIVEVKVIKTENNTCRETSLYGANVPKIDNVPVQHMIREKDREIRDQNDSSDDDIVVVKVIKSEKNFNEDKAVIKLLPSTSHVYIDLTS